MKVKIRPHSTPEHWHVIQGSEGGCGLNSDWAYPNEEEATKSAGRYAFEEHDQTFTYQHKGHYTRGDEYIGVIICRNPGCYTNGNLIHDHSDRPTEEEAMQFFDRRFEARLQGRGSAG